MILYTNGDSHTAAAEAVNPHAFANDDPKLRHLGRAPHPQNLAVSWETKLSQALKMMLHCDAESASSNARIFRTTNEYIAAKEGIIPPEDIFMIIQLSTWEREEWPYVDGEYYQVNASGIDDVPEEWKDKYKDYILNISWEQKTKEAFKQVIQMHEQLNEQGFKHVFFNGNNSFFDIPEDERYDFGASYIDPYLPEGTFDGWLQNAGYSPVITSNYHYGPDAHSAWAKHVIKHIIKHEMV